MKKTIATLLIAAAILTGCAKVRIEAPGCEGRAPATPIADTLMVVPPGHQIYLSLIVPHGATALWSTPGGPRTGGVMHIVGGTADAYGYYSVVFKKDNCTSDTTTIHVVSRLPVSYGQPSCTPFGSNRILYTAASGWAAFASPLIGYDNTTYYTLSGTDAQGRQLYVYIPTSGPPQTGTYYQLDSNGGQGLYAYIQLYNSNTQELWKCKSGNVYIYNNTSGARSVGLCGAVFDGPQGRFTLTGTCDYY